MAQTADSTISMATVPDLLLWAAAALDLYAIPALARLPPRCQKKRFTGKLLKCSIADDSCPPSAKWVRYENTLQLPGVESDDSAAHDNLKARHLSPWKS